MQQTQPPSFEVSALITLYKLQRYAEAESRTQLLISRYPEAGLLWKLLGASLQMQGKDALPAFQKAAQLLPDDPEPYNNLGIIFEERGQLDGAVTCYLNVLKIAPDFVNAHYNLGNVLCELGQPEKAALSYRRALAINPDFAEAHYNLGDALLALGRHSEGWQEYEYRLKDIKSQQLLSATQLPRWIGQKPSPNQRLLVLEEQGFGDKLQFARYLTLAAAQFSGGVSLVIGSPLRELFRRSFPGVEILDTIPVDQSTWHWQCPLLSLPLAFGTTLTTIPKQTPYLITDPLRVLHWQSRIDALGLPASTLKIGVAWKPGAAMKNAKQRSLTIQLIAPLLNQHGCVWFSLQKEPDPDSTPWMASGQLIDWTEEFGDFDETAALSMNLDLVISVDTSVAHLAGGLGRPIWLLNRYASEWRWMRDREDSPWYPTMRIFTQKNAGDWDELIRRTTNALTEQIKPVR